MIVAAVWFDRHDNIDRYERYATVWQKSAQHIFNNDVKILIKRIPPPDFNAECPVFYRGTRKIGPSKTLSWLKKIEEWHTIINAYPDEPVLLCDIDIAFFANPFTELLDGFDFDIGICGHNTGAVYFRGNSRSKHFMHRWWMATSEMVSDKSLYQKYDKKYKGLDQSSIGYVMEEGLSNANIIQLPRRFHSIWNDYEEPCYVMHYHSALRSVVFGDKNISILPDPIKKYAFKWWAYEKL